MIAHDRSAFFALAAVSSSLQSPIRPEGFGRRRDLGGAAAMVTHHRPSCRDLRRGKQHQAAREHHGETGKCREILAIIMRRFPSFDETSSGAKRSTAPPVLSASDWIWTPWRALFADLCWSPGWSTSAVRLISDLGRIDGSPTYGVMLLPSLGPPHLGAPLAAYPPRPLNTL